MSFATVSCRAQLGLQAPQVQVEVSLSAGLPTFCMVGLPATVVKESRDRVRAALINSGFEFPAGRITVNLSPAELPKRGGRFDLPVAIGILLASGQIRRPSCGAAGTVGLAAEFYGELGLSGELKGVPGLLLAAARAARDGREVVVPRANWEEVGVLVRGHPHWVARAADDLSAVCAHLEGRVLLPEIAPGMDPADAGAPKSVLDLSDVRGQTQAKRALALVAAGGHSMLMIGPPGAGKSMLARRLAGLLPPLSLTEALEVAAIASASPDGFSIRRFGERPVRAPHHTASAVALVGGGARASPGEISLAHHGVLFLDELLEFDRRALEALREPLETGTVCVTRAAVRARYPAEFQLIAAMNPCPCGRLGELSAVCQCTPAEVSRYRGRISGPLLDRLDIHIEVPRVQSGEFLPDQGRSSNTGILAGLVARARRIQLDRQGVCNARLSDGQLTQCCPLDEAATVLLERAMRQFGFSARGRQRILKLARTIADLAGEAVITGEHLGEAVTYRMLDRRSE